MRVADGPAERDRAILVANLRSAGEGSRPALQRVYDLTSAKLFGICLRISGDREAAEDILQTVYLKIWRRAARFDAERASPITWMATIARNASIDWRRAERRHLMQSDAGIADMPDDALLPDIAIEQDQRGARLAECLAALEDRQSAAIRDAFFAGLTYQELSDRAGTPLGTMKSWIRRGLLKLRECLGDG